MLGRLRAVPVSRDRVPSAEERAARRTGREVRRILRAAYASALGTQSQEGKGGTGRSLDARKVTKKERVLK